MLNDFDKDPRKQQESRGKPIADAIYKARYPGCEIRRFDREEEAVLDIKFAIDVQLKLASGHILTCQEKFLSYKYASFNSVTVEYMQDPKTGEEGDWFKLAVQIYFVGYFDKDNQSFLKWIIVDWPAISKATSNNKIEWMDNQNKDGRAKASFRYVNWDKIPPHCIIAKYHKPINILHKQIPLMQQWEIDAGVWYDKDGNPNCGYRHNVYN